MNSREIHDVWDGLRRFYDEHGQDRNIENYDVTIRQMLALLNNKANRVAQQEQEAA